MAAPAAAPRRPAESPSVGRETVRQAALEPFVPQGFHGASMRDVARRARASVSHAYYYYPAKSDLLLDIMVRVTEDLIGLLEQALAAAGTDPAARLRALVEVHVRLHTERQAEAWVGNSELRSLSPDERVRVVALRDRIATMFRQVVADGLAAGTFRVADPHVAVLALISMCTAVAGWYRPDGATPPEAMAARHADLALAMFGWRPPA